MTAAKQKERTLRELFITELADAYDGEKQLIKALPGMAAAAQDTKLRAAFTSHLAETKGQVTLLEEIFALLDLKPRGKHCHGIEGIIDEGKGAIEEITESSVRDTALAAGGRRAEHYEIAAYTSLIAMAEALGHADVSKKLGRILAQEVAAEKTLTELGQAALLLAQAEMPVEA